MKTFFNILNKNNSNTTLSESMDNSDERVAMDIDKIKDYKNEIIIEDQPFRLSGLLHNLTNKLAHLIKDHQHTIYYDIDNEIGRYVVGDNNYIEQVLEILMQDALSLNKESRVILKISYKSKFLFFEVINEKEFVKKNILLQYTDVKQISSTQSQNVNIFAKAMIIAKSMNGMITVKSSRISGTRYIFNIPYYEDKHDKKYKKELQKVLANKKVLFICKDKYDSKRIQYILDIYNIHFESMKVTDFVSKKPNLSKYDMVIIRSIDLSYKHISFLKTISKNEISNFKLIILHELFEDKAKIKLSKSIADAELYKPIIIGDVEEILYQLFITKSNVIKGINNMDIFNSKAFIIKGNHQYKDDYLTYYRGVHIAIVTDIKVDENILKNIFIKDGITLFCMRNGSEMIDLLEDEEIDMIFSDTNMPVMDGILMTRKIRSMKEWKKIPIISISSMAFSHELKKMEQAGMNAAISKPIEANDVYRVLENFLIMTDKIRMRKDHKNEMIFSFNQEVLDVEKGIRKAKNNIEYLEILVKTLEYLRVTRDSLENMIYEQEFIALSKYARTTLTLCEDIYAPAMINMFKDLNYFILQRQRTYLIDYIPMYKMNLEALEEEVEKYIHNA